MTDPYMAGEKAVQDAWPNRQCYGCGPANPDGIQLKSYVSDDGESLVAEVDLDEKYTSGAENITYGGAIADLIDCHSMWTAITFASREEGRPLDSEPPIYYVTGQLGPITYREPTPLDEPIHLKAWVEGEVGDKTEIRCKVGSGNDPDLPKDVEGDETVEAYVVGFRKDDFLDDRSPSRIRGFLERVRTRVSNPF